MKQTEVLKQKHQKAAARQENLAKQTEHMHKKLKDSNRIVEKVMNTRVRSHSVKTARQHREREYFKKEHMEVFHKRMIGTVEALVKMLRDAFKRDEAIC